MSVDKLSWLLVEVLIILNLSNVLVFLNCSRYWSSWICLAFWSYWTCPGIQSFWTCQSFWSSGTCPMFWCSFACPDFPWPSEDSLFIAFPNVCLASTIAKHSWQNSTFLRLGMAHGPWSLWHKEQWILNYNRRLIWILVKTKALTWNINKYFNQTHNFYFSRWMVHFLLAAAVVFHLPRICPYVFLKK